MPKRLHPGYIGPCRVWKCPYQAAKTVYYTTTFGTGRYAYTANDNTQVCTHHLGDAFPWGTITKIDPLPADRKIG